MTVRTSLLLLVVALLISVGASATTIDFNITQVGGTPATTFAWGGGNGAASASGNNLTATSTNPAAGPVFLCGNQNFCFQVTTGPEISFSNGTVTFGPGGNIFVYGCGTDCMTGAFTSSQIVLSGAGNTATFVGSFVAGTINPKVFTELGLPDPGTTDVVGSLSFQIALDAPLDAVTGGTGEFQSGDLTVAPVPEPSSLVLFGGGLLGIGGLIRRRISG